MLSNSRFAQILFQRTDDIESGYAVSPDPKSTLSDSNNPESVAVGDVANGIRHDAERLRAE